MRNLLNENEVAEWVGLSVACIRRWRHVGKGPKHVKLSDSHRGPVRYRPEDVYEWLDDRVVRDGDARFADVPPSPR
jgi:predicted DNA-binding transcriptional regulator AlpA